MKWWTVYLFRSSRVWVMEGKQDTWPAHIDRPLLAREVEAKTDIAAIGKVLLEYVDRANQTCTRVHLTDKPVCALPHMTECVNPAMCFNPAIGPTCAFCLWESEPCMCGSSRSAHTELMSPAHVFIGKETQ